MTNQLDTIKSTVSTHFAAKEARTQAFINDPSSFAARVADDEYNSQQHAAMLMLRDLLPLLEATVVLGDKVDYSSAEIIAAAEILENEVAKLLEEVE